MSSLRSKIAFGFYAFGGGILAVAAFAYLDLHVLADRIEKGEAIAGFFDTTLELRRYEKNFFLYGQEQDYQQAAQFAHRAEALLLAGREAFATLATPEETAAMRSNLERYQMLFERYRKSPDEALAMDIRSTGRQVVDTAEMLSREERRRITTSTERAGTLLLAGLTLVALAGGLIVRFLGRAVSEPLARLEQGLQSIGKGYFDRIEPMTQDREIVSVANAVNRMLAELEIKRRRLLQSEKLAALGTLAAGVAHELNNPLSNISTSNQLAQEDLARCDRERLAQWCAQIDAETVRAQRIVRSLLDFSRDHPLESAVVPLAEIFDKAMALVRTSIPADATIDTDIARDLPVYADRHALQQVFVNLMQNAFDARPEGLHVRISARRMRGAEAIAACSEYQFASAPEAKLAPRDVIQVTVEDNGPGMAAETLARIFDPFFTTRDVGRGSGLGLYIAQDIVHRHEGAIGAASAPGHGARFVLILPSTPDPSTA